MKKLLGLGAALLASAALFASRAPEGVEPGSQAPEINSKQWFNHIGLPMTLADLRGQAVLIEFWATW